MSAISKTKLAIIAGAVGVSAHGFVQNAVINGNFVQGYDPTKFPYMPTPPMVIGWTDAQTDLGFVDGTTYGTGDIICHKSATNAKGSVSIAAGDKLQLAWTVWPDSHKGPVIDYMADCKGDCSTVDKSTLEWFKIDEAGLSASGQWASDALIANQNSWMVEIPPTLKAGNYVLRHEMIALHAAGSTNQAQHYPQCLTLQVTGGGSDTPTGVVGTSLYKNTDPGLLINIYTTLTNYTIPGPPMIPGGVNVPPAVSAVTATISATPAGAGGGGAAAPTSAAASQSAAAANPAAQSSAPANSAAKPAVTSAPAAAAPSASPSCGFRTITVTA